MENITLMLTHDELVTVNSALMMAAVDADLSKSERDDVGNLLEIIKKQIHAPKMVHWIEDRDDNRTWDRVRFICSNCGEWQTYGKTKFCPECGAKMQEVKG